MVWQKPKAFTSEIYRRSGPFPKSKIYGLTSQLRRAAVSVASNIAEGQGRLTKREFCYFLGQARGSLLQLEAHLSISLDLHFLEEDKFHDLQQRSFVVRRLLNGLIESMRVRVPVTGNTKFETRN